MIVPVSIGGLALAVLLYCGAKTVSDFRAERLGWATFGLTVAILAPAALTFLAVTLAQFVRAGGL